MYEVINVTPDTPEWLDERRKSIGASEAAAALGMSEYGTPLTVYKSKLGIDDDFDQDLAWVGHASEAIIHRWVMERSGLNVTLEPGFMARSVEHPYLHATFDRVTAEGNPVQFKTGHQFTAHKWDEGIPTAIRVQVQAEMCVKGANRALVVVWIGGREFRHFWEPRDDEFINEHLLPGLHNLWVHVTEGTPPPPHAAAEIPEVWPGETPTAINLDQDTFDLLEELTVSRADRAEMEKREDELKLAIAAAVGNATELCFEGRTAYTFRPQKGRDSLDRERLEHDHPGLLAEYTRQGSPQRIIRYVKPKEKK